MSRQLVPASFSQEGHWIVEKVDGAVAPLLNVVRAFLVDGELAAEGLSFTLTRLMQRHEVLRTSLREVDGELMQIVEAEARPELRCVELGDRPEADRKRGASELLREFSVRRFDLSREPPLRALLLRLGDGKSIVALAAHHAAVDGWSGGIILGELVRIYDAWREGRSPELEPLQARYADFACLQRSRMSGDLASGLAYWTTRLAGARSQRPVVSDAGQGGSAYAARTERFGLPEDLSRHVREQALAANVTPFVFLVSALAVVMQRHKGNRDVLIGTPFACRNEGRWEGVVGPFANTAVLRLDVDPGCTIRQFIQEVREVVKQATKHSEVPFHRIVRAVRSPDQSNFSLYDTFLSLQNWPPPPLDGSRLELRPIALDTLYTDCELTWDLSAAGSAMGGQIDYQISRLSTPAACRMLAHWQAALAQMSADSGRTLGALELFTPEERHRLNFLGAGGSRAYDRRPVHEQLDERARATPDAPAAVHGGRSLSFAELGRASDRVAARLRESGVRRGDSVAACLAPGLELALAVLGAMKAGAVVAPIDPAEPLARRRAMLAILKPAVGLVGARGAGDLGELSDVRWLGVEPSADLGAAAPAPPDRVSPDDVSNVFFTSGSTGVPRAAFGRHRALSWYVAAMVRELSLTADDRVLQLSPVGFDVVFEELLPVWSAGGAVVFRDEYGPLEPERLLEQIERHRISVVELPNVYWNTLADLLETGRALPPTLRWILVGCGAVATERARRLLKQTAARLVHVYGLTEATITTTTFDLMSSMGRAWSGPSLPIGRPLPNLTVHVLDQRLQPVPVGISGELYVGGDGLTEGYLGEPAATAAKFVPDPFTERPGRRLLRTGDRVRWSDEGLLEFQGRADDQTKIRGCRVELEEVEALLREHPAVLDALVAVSASDPDQLVAAIVSRAAAEIAVADLRKFARARLPGYMRPSRWLLLDALPTGPHGKADRAAVAAMRPPRDAEPAAPRTAAEAAVADLFGTLLGCANIDRGADFFELGGHSLLAIRLMSRLNEQFGARLTLHDVFRCSTVEALAPLLALRRGSRSDETISGEVRV